jgi:preprotein translocase subunit SecE
MAIAQVQSDDDSRSFSQRALGWPARLKSYYEDLRMEMRRVTWPSWKQVRATTSVVIATVFAFAVYFFLVDLVLGRILTKVFESLSR